MTENAGPGLYAWGLRFLGSQYLPTTGQLSHWFLGVGGAIMATLPEALGIGPAGRKKEKLSTCFGGIYMYMDKNEKKNLINALIMFGEQNNWIYR